MSQQLPVVVSANNTAVALQGKNRLRLLLASMRPHQWTKNLFVLAPLLFGRKLTDPAAVGQSLLAFVTFCLLASAVYIFNDWLDADDDRAHPEKKDRPISSGALSESAALVAAVLLVAAATTSAVLVGPKFTVVAGAYAALMVTYCVALKKVIVLDAMSIAVGFVLRVVAGAVAVNVETTHWLIACTFLLALFLAFAKRRQELIALSVNATDHRQVLGQYSVAYLEHVNNILIGAAIVCYALYTVAPETISRFGTDKLIYGSVFVIYGMFRYLALTTNTSRGGNPSKLLLTDVPLLLTVSCWAAFNAIIIYRIDFASRWLNIP